jgi:hypothetical protein
LNKHPGRAVRQKQASGRERGIKGRPQPVKKHRRQQREGGAGSKVGRRAKRKECSKKLRGEGKEKGR